MGSVIGRVLSSGCQLHLIQIQICYAQRPGAHGSVTLVHHSSPICRAPESDWGAEQSHSASSLEMALDDALAVSVDPWALGPGHKQLCIIRSASTGVLGSPADGPGAVSVVWGANLVSGGLPSLWLGGCPQHVGCHMQLP